ncbi:hypothetical protein FGO68_gene411 [Halteria grandinella]|uniref:Uncharacterized protein n=1 Tax=Halteria grandinella TaxID=5974 RepID=A0A8J8NWU9_HALGN|nr:hypothetical protein FGO68_gene411 [Halteria grandinella]
MISTWFFTNGWFNTSLISGRFSGFNGFAAQQIAIRNILHIIFAVYIWERILFCEHEVKNNPRCPNVGFASVILLHRSFRRKIFSRSNECRVILAFLVFLNSPKISNLCNQFLFFFDKQNITWLEVPMHQACLMHVIQCEANLYEPCECLCFLDASLCFNYFIEQIQGFSQLIHNAKWGEILACVNVLERLHILYDERMLMQFKKCDFILELLV